MATTWMTPRKKILLFLVGLEVIYLILANGLLKSKAPVVWINTKPEEFAIDYRSGFSWIPGVLSLEDAALRLTDDNIELYLKLKKVKLRLGLFRLLTQTVSVSGLEIDEVESFRLRRRALKSEFQPAIPPPPDMTRPLTAGFSLPFVGTNSKWTVKFSGVEIGSIREMWLEEYQARGKAAAGGGFQVTPGVTGEVFPVYFTLHEGEILHRGKPIVSKTNLELSGSIRRFQKIDINGWNIFEYISARAKGESAINQWGFLSHYLTSIHWLHLGFSESQAKWNVVMENGNWRSDSSASLDSPQFQASLGPQRFIGKGTLDWKQASEDGKLSLLFTDYDLKTPSGKRVLHGSGLGMDLCFRGANLLNSIKKVDIRFQFSESTIPNFSALNEFIPESVGLKFFGGHGKVDGVLVSDADHVGRDRGKMNLVAEKISLGYDDYPIEGTMKLKVNIHKGSLDQSRLDISGTEIILSDLKTQAVPEPWNGRLELLEGEISFGEKPSLSGKARFVGKDARPIFGLLSHRGSIPGILEKISSLADVSAAANFKIRPEGLAFWDALVTASGINLVGWYEKGKDRRGRVLVRLGPLAAGVEFQGEKSMVHLENAARWFYEHPTPTF